MLDCLHIIKLLLLRPLWINVWYKGTFGVLKSEFIRQYGLIEILKTVWLNISSGWNCFDSEV